MKSYRDLDIYKDSKRLATEVHKMSLTLPKFEMHEEGGQPGRSSKSFISMIGGDTGGGGIRLILSYTLCLCAI